MLRSTTKTVVILLLLVAMLLPVLSCTESTSAVTTSAVTTANPTTQATHSTGNSTQGTEETPTTTIDVSATLHDIPDDVKFDGDTITFAYVEGRSGSFTARSIKIETEESDGDSVDAQVHQRNEKVQERLGVTIELYLAGDDINTLTTNIKPVLSSGDDEYDVIAGYQYYDIGLAAEGLLYNINEMNGNYIDISKAYWATEYINGINYKDKTFWVTGDLALRYTGGMYGTFINARIYNTALKATYNDIYDIARSGINQKGGWTLDLLMEMAAIAYQDTGSVADVPDEDDQLGFIIEMMDPCDGIAFGCDISFSKIDPETGKYVCDFNQNNTSAIALASKLAELYESKYCLIPEGNDSANQMTIFSAGNVFCTINKIYQSEVYLREMDDDFYILPTPKLDENQLNYVTGIHDGCTIFGISSSSDVPSAASATLEMLAAEGYKTVVPAYYDEALKYKYTRGTDGGSAEMIDLIRSNVRVDFVAAWSNSIGGMVHSYRGKATALKNFASTLKKSAGAYNKKLGQLQDKLDAIVSPVE